MPKVEKLVGDRNEYNIATMYVVTGYPKSLPTALANVCI